jgi:hypothetical protein
MDRACTIAIVERPYRGSAELGRSQANVQSQSVRRNSIEFKQARAEGPLHVGRHDLGSYWLRKLSGSCTRNVYRRLTEMLTVNPWWIAVLMGRCECMSMTTFAVLEKKFQLLQRLLPQRPHPFLQLSSTSARARSPRADVLATLDMQTAVWSVHSGLGEVSL